MAMRGRRPEWGRLPDAVRDRVEAVLGGRVAQARSMPGGWSPGSADRLVLTDGRRAFVKAVDARVNAVTARLHRREAAVLASLHGSGVAPELLGEIEEGTWSGLVVADVDGRHPDPTDAADTRAVLDAVVALPDPAPAEPPPGEDDLRTAIDDCAAGWRRLLESGAETVPGGERTVRALLGRSRGAGDAVGGAGLVHGDLRLDNVLIDRGGRARLLDWPAATEGKAWFDGATYLLDAFRLGGPRPVFDHPVFDGVDEQQVDAVLAALAGYFFDCARRPADPGMEGVRGFQREQGLVLLDLLLPREGQGRGRY